VSTAELDGWADEPVADGSVPSVAQTVVRHGGGLWPEVGAGGSPTVVLMLPIADRGPAGQAPAGRVVAGSGTESRPEFYDFDLFERRERTGDWTHALLSELAYTVFDTETTGLLPTEGDEVVAIGAVRVVNGRLLRQESFERLVDPRRSVPEVSTAVHGLTREMLRGRPTIEVVLPEFARYAADTVLVGHNVGFDLQFLRVKEQATGVRLRQPVLDTLLLDAVASPEHEGRSLEAIATRCGIEVVDRHSALGDAVVTAEVLLRLVTLLERQGVRTLGEALTASRATMQARLDQRMYGA
jgi:DNA polymerase-3 subunit epsilon